MSQSPWFISAFVVLYGAILFVFSIPVVSACLWLFGGPSHAYELSAICSIMFALRRAYFLFGGSRL